MPSAKAAMSCAPAPAARAIFAPAPGLNSTLWTIVPIGMPENGMALPGFTSVLAPAIT
mgnify:CR=1 FL=1